MVRRSSSHSQGRADTLDADSSHPSSAMNADEDERIMKMHAIATNVAPKKCQFCGNEFYPSRSEVSFAERKIVRESERKSIALNIMGRESINGRFTSSLGFANAAARHSKQKEPLLNGA